MTASERCRRTTKGALYMQKTKLKKWKIATLIFMSLLLSTILIMQQFNRIVFEARTAPEPPRTFSLTEINHDTNIFLTRITDNMTIVYLRELTFTPRVHHGMNDWNSLNSGERVRVTIHNAFNEWARLALTYLYDNGTHRLVGGVDDNGQTTGVNWEWLNFENNEAWRIDFYATRPNNVTLNYHIAPNDIDDVIGFFGLPTVQYQQVQRMHQVFSDEQLAPVVSDIVADIFDAAINGNEVSAYSRWFEMDFGDDGGIYWDRAAPFAPLYVSALSWRRVANLAMGVIIAAVVMTCVAIVTGNWPLAVTGLLTLAGPLAILVMGNIIGGTNINDVDEEAARVVEENIEFDTSIEEESDSLVLRLAFRRIYEDGSIGELQMVKDRSGRQLYYNRETRHIGNSRYAVLNHADMRFMRMSVNDTAILTSNGERMVIFHYTPADDRYADAWFANMPGPYGDEYYVLGSQRLRAVVSFYNRTEFNAQTRGRSFPQNWGVPSGDNMMIRINDSAALMRAEENRESGSGNPWNSFWRAFRSIFDGSSFGQVLRDAMFWVILVAGLIIVIIVVVLIIAGVNKIRGGGK